MTQPDKKTFDLVMALTNAVKKLDAGESLHHGTPEHEAVAIGVLKLADVVGDPGFGFSGTSDNDLDGYQAACEASVWLGDGNALEPQSMHHRALSWAALKLIGKYIHEPLQGAPGKGASYTGAMGTLKPATFVVSDQGASSDSVGHAMVAAHAMQRGPSGPADPYEVIPIAGTTFDLTKAVHAVAEDLGRCQAFMGCTRPAIRRDTRFGRAGTPACAECYVADDPASSA